MKIEEVAALFGVAFVRGRINKELRYLNDCDHRNITLLSNIPEGENAEKKVKYINDILDSSAIRQNELKSGLITIDKLVKENTQ